MVSFAIAHKVNPAQRVWNEALLDAIRNDLARPTVHARNLHHWSVACYDAWAAYDSVATPFLIDVEVEPIADPVARREAQETAMNYASYRLLWHRFLNSPGGSSTLMSFYQTFTEAGGVNSFQSTDVQEGPAALGNHIAEQVLAYGAEDGSNESNDYANQHYSPSVQTCSSNPCRATRRLSTKPLAKHQPQHLHWTKRGA